MKNLNITNNNKSMLAKLMATENLTVQHKNVETAMFDPDHRVLILPNLKDSMSEDVCDLFIGHEVGHALYSPPKELKTVCSQFSNPEKGKGYLNIIEDARIEAKIKMRYPGLKSIFYRGYQELIDNDFFGIESQKFEVAKLPLIDRINFHAKIGSFVTVPFSADEQIFVDRSNNLKTWEDTVSLAKDIYNYVGETEEQKQNDSDSNSSGDGDVSVPENDNENDSKDSKSKSTSKPDENDSDSDSDSKDSDENDSDSDSDSKDSDSDSDSNDSDENDSDSDSDSDSNDSDENDSDSDSDSDSNDSDGNIDANKKEIKEKTISEPDAPLTADTFNKAMESLIDNSKFDSEYLSLSENINPLDYIIPVKEIQNILSKFYSKNSYAFVDFETKFQAFCQNNKKIVNYLHKEFDMKKRADQYKRRKISKTGILNINKLHSYKYNDDIFRKSMTVASGKNHGLVMFIDWSGSMHGKMEHTIHELLTLVMFAKKANIPFDVYAFSDCYKKQRSYVYGQPKDEVRPSNNLWLLQLISSKLTNNSYKEALMNLYKLSFSWSYGSRRPLYPPTKMKLGCTPLNSTIVVAHKLIADFQKAHRLQIVNTIFLTDGESNDCCLQCGSNVILVDKKTRKEFSTNQGSKTDDYYNTTALLFDSLKSQTGVNVIGYFVTNDPESEIPGNSTKEEEKEYKTCLKKNNYFSKKCSGYSEYYVLQAENKGLDGTTDLIVNSIKTLDADLMNYSVNKIKHRVMLSKFVEIIS